MRRACRARTLGR